MNQPFSRWLGVPPPTAALRALRLAGLEEPDDLVALALGDDRADGDGRVVGVADRHRADAGGERVDELLVARTRGEDAGLRRARLTVVQQARHDQVLQLGLDVDVVEQDRGRLAAELEREPLDLLAAQRADARAGGGGAGEADLVDAGVRDEVLARLARRPRRC